MPREYDPSRTCMKVENWPAAERIAWEAALKPGRLFNKPGGGAHWAPLTRVTNAKSYGRWLQWLSNEGLLDPNAGPCQQVTEENVEQYMDHLATQVSTGMIVRRISDLYTIAKAFLPASDWSWIRNAWYRLRQDAKPVKNKAARVVNARDLFRFGIELMKRAEEGEPKSALFTPLMYRDGLIIALLAARPLRRENFTSIEIGKQLLRRGETYWLHFTEQETKNEIELDWPVPEMLVPYLQRYLTEYRPALLARHARFGRSSPPVGNRLWVSRYGSPLTAHGMYGFIVDRTKEKFGRSVNPHLFRDSLATTVAIEDPAHVMSTKSLLGHHDGRTSERYCNQARSTEAAFEHQNRLKKLRGGMRRS